MRVAPWLLAVAAPCAATFPSASVSAAFSCTENVACFGDFPGCPPVKPGTNITEWSHFTAWDDSLVARRLGPISTLPLSLNQKVVYPNDGFAYYIYIDASVTPEKTINCTKAPFPNQTAADLRTELLGYAANSARNGSAPCSESAPGRMGTCDRWTWLSQFGCDGVLGVEPESWMLAPAPGGAADGNQLVLASLTNDIWYPPSCPNNLTHSMARSDYTQDYKSNPDPSLFAVPSDCAVAVEVPAHFHPGLLFDVRAGR
jgi:hypothetical protein